MNFLQIMKLWTLTVIMTAINQIKSSGTYVFDKYFKSNVAGGGDLDAALNNKQSNPIGAEISGTSGLNLPDGFKLTLRDIQLATQNFAPNCYGNLKFC